MKTYKETAKRKADQDMANPLVQLQSAGQSVWYDNIDRAQTRSGEFQRMLEEDGILGVTANPTIFEKSISTGHAYDEQITQLISEGKSTNEIYEAVVIKDIRTVADLLHPIYDRTAGQRWLCQPGSLSRASAHDTRGHYRRGRSLLENGQTAPI